jgi:formate dehydrogenase subunit gamma
MKKNWMNRRNWKMKKKTEKIIQRFSKEQRLAHWAFAISFFILLGSGLILMLPSLSGLAADGTSRWLHRVGAVVFMLVPLYYYLTAKEGLTALVKDSFTFDQDDRKWLMKFFQYFFGRVKGMPPQGRINAGEKLHHALVIITFFTISISGLVLWVGNGALNQNIFLLMIIIHDVSMFIMLVLTIGHLYFTFVYGALGGMITGYVTETYARLEHAKWLAELENKQVKGGAGK